MVRRKMAMVFLIGLFFTVLSFKPCSADAAAANQHQQQNEKNQTPSFSLNRISSSPIFPLQGNVYPSGYYYVTVMVGNPPKPYFLDMDTGSDLTWLQCDAPCVRCYKTLTSKDKNFKCENPHDQCDYDVEYADQALSVGVLVKDAFILRLSNGTNVGSRLVFGCGYDQQSPSSTSFKADGVLGLGNGETGIVSQLRNIGLTRNVIGHCISAQGGGILFIGDDLIPSSGVVWTPMSQSSSLEKQYSPGTAGLSYGARSTGVNKHLVIFDSGSTYTYFNLQAYQSFIPLVRNLVGKQLTPVEDIALPVCWKGKTPFKSIQDVKAYFAPATLTFSKTVQLVIPPENYLIITERGNVCLGILNGSEVGLEDLNIIGDISLQDMLVIYDNEKHQIGWIPKKCPKTGLVP
ncbi:hypothetical protein ACHQM5_020124 [Ranunculus cassubicifolius]